MSLHDPKSWELHHPLSGHPCPVTGLIPHVEEKWTEIRPDYRLRTGVLEPGIILSLPVGHTAIADTDRFFANLKSILNSGHVDRDNFVLIEDYTFHTGSDYEGRIRYIERMIDEIQPKGIVFFTRSYFWRLNIRLGLAFGRWAINIKLASSYQQALMLASEILGRTITSSEASARETNRDSGIIEWASPRESVYIPSAELLPNQQIVEAMKILSALQWDNFGFNVDMDSTTDPDFERLIVAIGSLKHDVDSFLTSREEEMVALEEMAERAAQLSVEIDAELREARAADQLATQLANENQSLLAEISQSQKEVFLVLSDDVDIRSGANPGHTRALARQVARIAERAGCTPLEVRDMYDATLLHHIGFLGIPDTSDLLDENHCLVGQKVLEQIPGEVARIARDMAAYHHERYDGEGFPFHLKAEAIPLAARIVRLASEMADAKSDLAHMAGYELDPGLTALVISGG